MPRSIEDLEAHAEKYWPRKLTALEQDSSILPALLATQEKFIGVLYVADSNPHLEPGSQSDDGATRQPVRETLDRAVRCKRREITAVAHKYREHLPRWRDALRMA